MRPLPPGPLVSWYGDDFTGSAAVMEVLHLAGFPAVLFLALPDAGDLGRFPGMRGIGVAGDARSRSPEWMDAHLPQVFARLRDFGAPVVHYKVCSTLDSAPHVGSIGRAAELGLGTSGWAPVIVAAPAIGRWQAFGTLFAASPGGIVRLDRHPTMSVHPVTPMDEADIGRHLARQTGLAPGLVDLVALKSGAAGAALDRALAAGCRLIAFDVVDPETLQAAGAAVWQAAEAQIFAIGSQGLEYALVAAWRQAGLAPAEPATRGVIPVDRIAIVSGSCSPHTADQIAHAESAGFRAIHLDATTAVDARAWTGACAAAADRALAALGEGRSPLIHTARGPGDPALAAVAAAAARSGSDIAAINAAIGAGLGAILADVARRAGLGRVAIAGGDTASHGAPALGIDALTIAASLAPGAALLHGHYPDPATPPIEIALKGGQMGPADFFTRLRDGGASTP